MSTQQQRQLDANLRQGQFDTGGDVQALRASFGELMAQVPVPPDVVSRSSVFDRGWIWVFGN